MKMKFRSNTALALFATIATLTFARPVQAQYVGNAYGLKLNLLNLGLVTVGNTGALPSGGGGPLDTPTNKGLIFVDRVK